MMCGNSCWSCEWWFYKHLQDSDSSEVRTLSLTQLGVGKALTLSTCNFVHCLASIWNWYGSCLSYLVQEYILHADSTWQDSIIYGLIISLISVLFDDLFSLCPSLIILFLNIGTPMNPPYIPRLQCMHEKLWTLIPLVVKWLNYIPPLHVDRWCTYCNFKCWSFIC